MSNRQPMYDAPAMISRGAYAPHTPHRTGMNTPNSYKSLFGLLFLVACAKQPPPVSVAEFMQNPRLLEATMVRCGENRATMKYEAECVNARDAVNRLEAREEKARREELEAMSERKRQALRRTQQAAEAARRRAAEEARQDPLLGIAEEQAGSGVTGNEPAAAESNAPVAEILPPQQETTDAGDMQPDTGSDVGGDLNSIREELKRRQDEPQ